VATASTSNGAAAQRSSTSINSGVPATSNSSNQGITVNVIRPASTSNAGIVAVSIPKGAIQVNKELSIPLPPQNITNSGSQDIKVTLPNNAPAPAWIKVAPDGKSFVTSSVPPGSLPIQLVVTTGNIRTVVQILESSFSN
jgi:hypothetical protein